MGTTISLTFPLGRYHATRWDGGANTSDAEWPPSPWRILRALIAVWYARWPDLPAAELDDLLATLGTPSAYFTPPATPGSTRHYLPNVGHSRATTGNTDQVIDAFLAVNPLDALKVYWERELDVAQRATFGKLLELMPYLGRSESICIAEIAEIADAQASPDGTWWRLGESGDGIDRVELLAPDGAVKRALLEASTIETRKARRLIPIGARWVSYGRATPSRPAQSHRLTRPQPVEALLFELSGQVPVRARNSILATDAMHGLVAKILSRHGPAPGGSDILGRTSAGEPRRGTHDHLHIVPLTGLTSQSGARVIRANDTVRAILLWSPIPIPADIAAQMAHEARRLSVREQLADAMASQQLLFAGAGSIDDLAPGLAGEHRCWISALPYLPVRHRKPKEDDNDFLRLDIGFECRYRKLPEPVAVERIGGADLLGQVAQFRRRRAKDSLDKQRRGVYLRLCFDAPVAGPLLLGQLSHFGFGSFVPDPAYSQRPSADSRVSHVLP